MPELTEQELKKQIETRQFAKLYLLFGNEPYFILRYTDRLLDALVDPAFSAFNLQRFHASETNAEQVQNAVTTLPFLAERKCVTVSDWNPETLNADETAKWKTLLADIPDTTTLILFCPSVPVDRKRSNKWKPMLTLAAKHGVITECKKREPAEIERLLCAYAAKRQCNLSRRDAGQLLALCGNDLQTLFHETEKLCAYTGSGDIASQTIDLLAVRNAETTVFLLAKALIAGDGDRAYLLLDQLLQQNESPVAILSVLSSSYLDLYRVKAALESGKTAETPAEDFPYRGKEFRLRAAARDVRGISLDALRQSLDLLLETDLALKSSAADQRILLEKLFARLFQLR